MDNTQDGSSSLTEIELLIKALRQRKSVVVGRREDGTLDLDTALKEQKPAGESEIMLKKHVAAFERFCKRWAESHSQMGIRVRELTTDIRLWEMRRAKIHLDHREWFSRQPAIERAELVILAKKILQDSRIFRLKIPKNKWANGPLSSIDYK